ncbi:MAG: cation transporter [Chroococcidiopsidaceae cyanobacterium CP_BM_RX_35]|nr:cation transporter [Chroococcidiopsidaceae cyanobacterium CP_BM_RX_35]
MILLVKERNGHRGAAIVHPCCNYSYLINEDSQSSSKTRLLWTALGILGSLFIAELTTGLWSHSLSLLAEAGHILSDVAGLGLTLTATWLAQRPATGQATFGHRRIEILAALGNGLSLLVIAGLIAWEAVERFQSPASVSGLAMVIVAIIGLAVNSINMALLHKASCNDLNLRGAWLHSMADAASSVGIILAATVIYFWNWAWIDAVVSLLIACSVGLNALPLVRESLEVLMEYAPCSTDPGKVEAVLNSFASVERVEKLHIWTITSGQVALSAHLTVEPLDGEQRDRLLRQLQVCLEEEFGIRESTLQLTSRRAPEAVLLHPLLHSKLIDVFAGKVEDCECR